MQVHVVYPARYFIPFFGERHLHDLTHQHIAEFERWRNHTMGKKRKCSKPMNFASAFIDRI